MHHETLLKSYLTIIPKEKKRKREKEQIPKRKKIGNNISDTVGCNKMENYMCMCM